MDTVELHELMPRNQLIPQSIKQPEILDIEALEDLSAVNYDGYYTDSTKLVENWNAEDIANWLIRVSKEILVDYTKLHGEKFVQIPGDTLLKMTEQEFLDVSPEFGTDLYISIKRQIMNPIANNYVNYDEYPPNSTKLVENWTAEDIANWLIRVSKEISVDYTKLHGEKFVQIPGGKLLKMTEQEFLDILPEFGTDLYISIKCQLTNPTVNNYCISDVNSKTSSIPVYEYKNGNASDGENAPPPSDVLEPAFTEPFTPPAPLQKRKRGRPSNPNKKGKKKLDNSFGRLWEFLRDLLKNPDTCPRIIKWENHEEGLFRFVQSDEVAKIWGRRKANSNMTYEKLSRAMRYYYKSDVLQAVVGRRLVYRFGPNATDWRVPDPNFERKKNSDTMMRRDKSAAC